MDKYDIKDKIKDEKFNLTETLDILTCHTDMGRFGCDTLDTDLAKEAIKYANSISRLLTAFLDLEGE